MATATKNIFGSVTLNLTKAEANTIAAVLYRVGGSPDVTPRKHTESITGALRVAGVTTDSDEYRALGAGTLYFNRYENAYDVGHAYIDADNDRFIRTHDGRWVDQYGHKQAENYPTRPLRKLA